jgi:hypothetical protein
MRTRLRWVRTRTQRVRKWTPLARTPRWSRTRRRFLTRPLGTLPPTPTRVRATRDVRWTKTAPEESVARTCARAPKAPQLAATPALGRVSVAAMRTARKVPPARAGAASAHRARTNAAIAAPPTVLPRAADSPVNPAQSRPEATAYASREAVSRPAPPDSDRAWASASRTAGRAVGVVPRAAMTARACVCQIPASMAAAPRPARPVPRHRTPPPRATALAAISLVPRHTSCAVASASSRPLAAGAASAHRPPPARLRTSATVRPARSAAAAARRSSALMATAATQPTVSPARYVPPITPAAALRARRRAARGPR